MSSNPIVHWELMGADGDVQKNFYSSIFDWKLVSPEGFGEYYMVGNDQVGVGGAVGKGGDEMPNYSAIYVQVDSIDESLAAIEANGGSTIMPRTEIPGTVIFGMFSDPAGNIVGLVEPDENMGE